MQTGSAHLYTLNGSEGLDQKPLLTMGALEDPLHVIPAGQEMQLPDMTLEFVSETTTSI
jgi:hypothetical protein